MLFCFFYGHFFFKLYLNFFSWSFKIANFIFFHKEHANFDFKNFNCYFKIYIVILKILNYILIFLIGI